eukprot:876927-Rhodomonas_salina.2
MYHVPLTHGFTCAGVVGGRLHDDVVQGRAIFRFWGGGRCRWIYFCQLLTSLSRTEERNVELVWYPGTLSSLPLSPAPPTPSCVLS